MNDKGISDSGDEPVELWRLYYKILKKYKGQIKKVEYREGIDNYEYGYGGLLPEELTNNDFYMKVGKDNFTVGEHKYFSIDLWGKPKTFYTVCMNQEEIIQDRLAKILYFHIRQIYTSKKGEPCIDRISEKELMRNRANKVLS